MGQGTNVQTGPNGEVYVCWADYDVDGTNKVIYPSHGLGFCSSTNGGVSFTPYQRVLNYTGIRASSAPDPIFNYIGVNDFPSMAVDKSNGPHRGRIYVVLPIKENGNGKAVIGFTFSDNQGGTWSAPITISIPTGRQNFFPWITVDDYDCSGDVWVTYYSFDTPSGFTTNTYVTHSVDGGATWESQKVSDVSHITAPINNSIFRAGYAGDYIGITAFGGRAYPIWMDNRNGTWQLYCSPITRSYSISGNESICSGSSSYTLNGVPVGTVVSWSSSNTSIATVTPTGNPVTVTKTGNGSITITASLNSCNTISKTINVGLPDNSAFNIYQDPTCNGNIINFGAYSGSTFDNCSLWDMGVTNITWDIPSYCCSFQITNNSGPGVCAQGLNNSGIQVYFSNTYIYNAPYIRFKAQNACGWSDWMMRPKPVNFSSCGQAWSFNITPNPATNSAEITLDEQTIKTDKNMAVKEIEITDKTGIVVRRFTYSGSNSHVTLDISNLKQDVYFIRVYNGKEWKVKTLSKQ